VVTKQGKPAAFSSELVGKYSAFEEIDLTAYLAVRREAVQGIAKEDPYAAILISMHTHNLLSDRADRSTIRAEDLPWLDAFLVEQLTLQRALRQQLLASGRRLRSTSLRRVAQALSTTAGVRQSFAAELCGLRRGGHAAASAAAARWRCE
jgi:hypothetical protein